MSRPRIHLALLIAAGTTGACAQPNTATPTTGLSGVVVRGPVTPVCRIDVPCDAPFSAGFTVASSGREVARFRSDTDGRFTVFLLPGVYRVVPDGDAPIIAPAAQAKTVEVMNAGLTIVRLEFDTGIR